MKRLAAALVALIALALPAYGQVAADTGKANPLPNSGFSACYLSSAPGLCAFKPGVGLVSMMIAPANLPLSGITAGTPAVAANSVLLSTYDVYGRATGTATQLIQATLSATSDSATNLGLTSRTLAAWMQDHASVLEYGAQCNSSTHDDGPALQRALYANRYSTAYYLEMPQGQFCYTQEGLIDNSSYHSFGGAGGKDSGLLIYNGASTTANILTIGTGTPSASSGQTAGGMTVHDLSITSSTVMTAGDAIYQANAGDVFYNNIKLVSPNLWNGAHFHETDYTRFTNFSIATKNDCLKVEGDGYATGPQYDLWIDGGKVTGCHAGVHMAGGFDGASFDHMEDTTVDYNVLIDEAGPFDNTSGTKYPNQEVWFGSQFVMGYANWDNVYINDPLAAPGAFSNVSIAGPITIAGNANSSNTVGGTAAAQNGIASGSFAGVAPPANSGDGVHIKSYPGGQVNINSPYAQFFASAFVLTEDANANVYVNNGVNVQYAKFGIYSVSANWAGLRSKPDLMTNIATPANNGVTYYNTLTPDLTSPYGGLKVGLATASDSFAQSVISNGGVEGDETACGLPLFAAGACRAQTINATHTTYYDKVYDAKSHTYSVSGTPLFGVGASAFNNSGATAYVLGSIGAGGGSGGFYIFDRANGLSQLGQIYRTGGVNYLWDNTVGNVASWSSAGLFQVYYGFAIKGHLYGNGTAPTITTSAGTATPSTGINDNHGTVNQSAAATVTIKFAAAYSNAPDCLVEAQNGGTTTYSTVGGAVGTAALTVTLTAAAKFTYHCMGQ